MRREQAKAHKNYQRKVANANDSGVLVEKTHVLAYEELPLEVEVAEDGIKTQATLAQAIDKKLDDFTDLWLIEAEKKFPPPALQKGQEAYLALFVFLVVFLPNLLAKAVVDLRKHGRICPATQRIFRGDILNKLDAWVKKQYRLIAKEYLWKIINKTGILKPRGDNWMVLSDASMEFARDNAARLGPI